MADARVDGFAAGLYEIAKAEGKLETVKNELLSIARTLESSQELRDALSNPALPTDRKQGIIDDLLGSRASALTVGMVGFITSSGMASSLPRIADALAEVAASASKRDVAEIRTAIDLDAETVAKIVAGLEKATGKSLEAKVVVDPDVMGGIIARVGDTVIDGSVQHRLAGLRQALKIR